MPCVLELAAARFDLCSSPVDGDTSVNPGQTIKVNMTDLLDLSLVCCL